jgi:long-chain fatty acid transport protein
MNVRSISVAMCTVFALCGRTAIAQTFGVELHNNLMPASGGMAGTSISRPQDLQSAINANPATLRQYQGTQFSFGGAWADANYNVNQSAQLPLIGVSPFSATSAQPGALLGNIGLTQDLASLGLPATLGVGLISNAGTGVDFRGVPQSNGTSAQLLNVQMVAGVGVDITDKLSLGGSFQLGTGYLDGPFTGFGGMATAYGARGTVGANYFLTPETSLGLYWQSAQHYDFDNAANFTNGPLGGQSFNVPMDLPSNVGLGIANSSLMEGKLLLAMDVLYKQWNQTDLFGQIYNDQWVYQFGAQYALTQRTRLRIGYAYNQDPMRGARLTNVDGINLPDGVPGFRYIQGQFAAITQNRLTIGMGIRDVMMPGVDFDVFAGYAFAATDTFATTTVSLKDNYWVGAGVTWRFGAARPECTPNCK